MFETIRNSAERLDLTAARSTIDYYGMEKINVTSIAIADWPHVCAWAHTLEIEPIMEESREAVQVQEGITFRTSDAI